MDAWEIFSELCRRVNEDRDCYLDVVIMPGITEMMLLPYDDEDWEEEDEE